MIETQCLKLSVKSSPFARCVRPIRKVLEKIEGVNAVGANYVAELIRVDLYPRVIDVNEIVSIVKAIGYEPVPRMD